MFRTQLKFSQKYNHFSISRFKGNVRYIQSLLKKLRNVKTSALQKEKRGGKNKDTFF